MISLWYRRLYRSLTGVFAPPAPILKHNFLFRSSMDDSGLGAVQDATQDTSVILAGTMEGTVSPNGIGNTGDNDIRFGRPFSVTQIPQARGLNSTQAGGDFRRGGFHTFSASVNQVEILTPAGLYNVWVAIGSNGASTSSLAILEDGYTPLLTVSGTTASGNEVATQNGNVGVAADFTAVTTPWPVRTTTGRLVVSKVSGATGYPRCVTIQRVSEPLVDISLLDETGVPIVGNPVALALQPAGIDLFTLVTVNGACSVASFTLGGDLAPYFTVVKRKARAALVASALPLSNSFAGTRTLTVTQADPSATGPKTRTTTFSFSVFASPGKPTDGSKYAMVSAWTWAIIAKVRSVHATWLWAGCGGQTMANGAGPVVHNTTDLNAAVAALPQGNGNTAFYRVQLGTETNEGFTGSFNAPNMGSGGLLIERADDGSDPAFNASCNGVPRGVHIRGVKCPLLGMSNAYQWTLGLPSAGGPYARITVENCRIGCIFAGATINNNGNTATLGGTSMAIGNFLTASHGESVNVIGNTFNGVYQCLSVPGVFTVNFVGNDLQQVMDDVFHPNPYGAQLSSPYGIFPDNNQYIWRGDQGIRNELNLPALSGRPHIDVAQALPLTGNTFAVNPATGQSISSGVSGYSGYNNPLTKAAYRVGEVSAVPSSGWVYKVTAVTGGGYCNHTPPVSTTMGTLEVDGGVTWTPVQPYMPPADIWMVWDNELVNESSPAISNPNLVAGRNLFENSAATYGWRMFMAAINLGVANGQSSGLSGGGADGEINVENSVFTSQPVSIAGGQRTLLGGNTGWGGKLRERNCVTGQIGTAPHYYGQNNVLLDWSSGSVDPNTVLAGPFTAFAATYATSPAVWNYAWNYDGTDSLATFMAAGRSFLTAAVPGGPGLFPS